MKECRLCGKELNPKTVYGGFFGFMYRLFFWKAKKNYKEFSNCQECRDLYMMGYSAHEILMIKNKDYKQKYELVQTKK